jgi:hypothetical protein
MRTRWALVCGIACDIVLLLGVSPLARFSWQAAHAHVRNLALLGVLLVLNAALMLLCFVGAALWVFALVRAKDVTRSRAYRDATNSFRATHASVANETAAITANSDVSSSTMPAN